MFFFYIFIAFFPSSFYLNLLMISLWNHILICTLIPIKIVVQEAIILMIFHSYHVTVMMFSTLVPLHSLSTLVVQTLAVMFRETGAEATKLDLLTAEK